MTTILSNFFKINGVLSTDKGVLQNINDLCTASAAWMTYDIADGKWSVVINRAGTSVASFNDSNIIGGINISGTGINELYNQATIEFPHKDLRDQSDYVDLSIPSGNRFANELDNRLNIRTDLVNDPVQAQYLASVELKQSRIDKVIQFRTDYSKIGLKAGDLIDVTSDVYGYAAKVFRITKVEEDDGDVLSISITALEYDSDVYSTAGLNREIREKKTGIVPKNTNAAVKGLDNQASLKMDVTSSAKDQGISLFYVTAAAAAANAALSANTWYVDYAGKKAVIAASDVVVTWVFPDGEDLDIRCRLVQPAVGQNTLDQTLGYTGSSGAPSEDPQFPDNSVRYWPLGSSPGTAYLEWGGDNTGVGGNFSSSESVRIDIDRIKTVFPSKRYIAVECRGNWYTARGSKPVILQAKLYEGGTTTRSGFNFANAGATRTRELDSQGVFVDSLHGDTVMPDGYDGTNAPGELMGYFLYDTVEQYGQFVQTLPPAASQ